MLGTHDLALFVVAGLLLNITPGPDMLYIIGRSATQGLKAGAAATLGVSAGCLVHIAAAALGLSALLTASAAAFTVVKVAGALYLVYVGISLLGSSGISLESARREARPPAPPRAIFVQGFFTNVLNPKVALFFLAFLPQFIDPQAESKPVAFLFLGAIFTTSATLWNLFVAWGAAHAGTRISARAAAWFNRCIGAFFCYLGVRLLFSDRAS